MSQQLINARDRSPIAVSISWARSPWERARGLIGRPPLSNDEALVIESGGQVHTFFMRGSIDVVFCDQDGTVLHVISPMRRRRVSRWVHGSARIIELAEGRASQIRPGDRLLIDG